MTPYHFSITVHGDFDQAVEKTRTALHDHDFKIVSEIDMTERLGLQDGSYLILGACNQGFARQAVSMQPSVGVLLPCNVVVRTTDGDGVMVDFMDPAVLIDLVGEEGLHRLADEIRTRLEMTRDAIATA